MDHAVQQNAAMVEQSTATSHTLAQDAENLNRLMAQFTIDAAATGEALSAHGRTLSGQIAGLPPAARMAPAGNRPQAPRAAGSHASGPHTSGPRAIDHSSDTRSAQPSPARNLMNRLSGAFTTGGAAKAQAAPTRHSNPDQWEEF